MKKKGPKAITVRRVPPSVQAIIGGRSAESGQSRKVLHHDLDALFGAWSDREAAAFDRHLAEQRRIDPDLWS
jgi:hypothetical protein